MTVLEAQCGSCKNYLPFASLILAVLFLLSVTRDASAVSVLTTSAIWVDVAVLAVSHTICADCLFLEGAVVVLIAPSDAAIFVLLSVPPQNLQELIVS